MTTRQLRHSPLLCSKFSTANKFQRTDSPTWAIMQATHHGRPSHRPKVCSQADLPGITVTKMTSSSQRTTSPGPQYQDHLVVTKSDLPGTTVPRSPRRHKERPQYQDHLVVTKSDHSTKITSSSQRATSSVFLRSSSPPAHGTAPPSPQDRSRC